MTDWKVSKTREVKGVVQEKEGCPPRLLLRPAEAAETLALSPRMLWTLTDKGEIPCLRIRRAVRYDPRDLIAWIDRQKREPEIPSEKG